MWIQCGVFQGRLEMNGRNTVNPGFLVCLSYAACSLNTIGGGVRHRPGRFHACIERLSTRQWGLVDALLSLTSSDSGLLHPRRISASEVLACACASHDLGVLYPLYS